MSEKSEKWGGCYLHDELGIKRGKFKHMDFCTYTKVESRTVQTPTVTSTPPGVIAPDHKSRQNTAIKFEKELRSMCPATHPYAFVGGRYCCASGHIPNGYYYNHYNSNKCWEKAEIGCSRQPCYTMSKYWMTY